MGLDQRHANISFTGGDDLDRKLNKLAGPVIARKALDAGLRRGARMIAKEAKSILKSKLSDAKEHKKLVKSIGYKLWHAGKTRVAIIGPRISGKWQGYHSHLFEFGTVPRYQKTTGRYTGIMPAKPFMRPAFLRQRHNAVAEVRKVLAATIKAVARRKAGTL